MEDPGTLLEPLRATVRVLLKTEHPEWDAALLLEILAAYDAKLDRLASFVVELGALEPLPVPPAARGEGRIVASLQRFTLAELGRMFSPPRAAPDPD